MTRERRYQIRKREKGLCRICTKPAHPARRGLCEKHRAVFNQERDSRQRIERAVERAMRAYELYDDVIGGE